MEIDNIAADNSLNNIDKNRNNGTEYISDGFVIVGFANFEY